MCGNNSSAASEPNRALTRSSLRRGRLPSPTPTQTTIASLTRSGLTAMVTSPEKGVELTRPASFTPFMGTQTAQVQMRDSCRGDGRTRAVRRCDLISGMRDLMVRRRGSAVARGLAGLAAAAILLVATGGPAAADPDESDGP